MSAQNARAHKQQRAGGVGVVCGAEVQIKVKRLVEIGGLVELEALEGQAGQIGAEAFKRIVLNPKLKDIPFICETPVDKPGDDVRNIQMMRKLSGVPTRSRRR